MNAQLPLPTARSLRSYWAASGTMPSAVREQVTNDDITVAMKAALDANPAAAAAFEQIVQDGGRRLVEIAAASTQRGVEAAANPRYANAPEVTALVTFEDEDPETMSVVMVEQRSFTAPLSWLVSQDRMRLAQVTDRDDSSDGIALELGWSQAHPSGGGPLTVEGLRDSLSAWLEATES